MKNNKPTMNNTQLLMFYHTTFRNVALTTAVSYATLGYSRYYRGKSKVYVAGLIIVSMLLVTCSVVLNYNLYNIILEHNSVNKKLNSANRFLILNKLFLLIHSIVFLFAGYTLLRIINGNTF
jgi:hypothetical protein|tara:strand:- start:94 stop:459 length:366 start_codon:yes stop_codon:yes gene_type:complete